MFNRRHSYDQFFVKLLRDVVKYLKKKDHIAYTEYCTVFKIRTYNIMKCVRYDENIYNILKEDLEFVRASHELYILESSRLFPFMISGKIRFLKKKSNKINRIINGKFIITRSLVCTILTSLPINNSKMYINDTFFIMSANRHSVPQKKIDECPSVTDEMVNTILKYEFFQTNIVSPLNSSMMTFTSDDKALPIIGIDLDVLLASRKKIYDNCNIVRRFQEGKKK